MCNFKSAVPKNKLFETLIKLGQNNNNKIIIKQTKTRGQLLW